MSLNKIDIIKLGRNALINFTDLESGIISTYVEDSKNIELSFNQLTKIVSITIFANTSGTTPDITTGTFFTIDLNDGNGAQTITSYSTFITLYPALFKEILPAQSFEVNKLTSAQTPTNEIYKEVSGVYTGTITWSNSAPTGTTNHYFKFKQIGSLVILNVTLSYTILSANNTTLLIKLPTEAPTPVIPAGFTGADRMLFNGTFTGSNSYTTLSNLSSRQSLKRNNLNDGFDLFAGFSAVPFLWCQFQTIYFTA